MTTIQNKNKPKSPKHKSTEELLKELRAYNKHWAKIEKQDRMDNSTPEYFKIKRVSI